MIQKFNRSTNLAIFCLFLSFFLMSISISFLTAQEIGSQIFSNSFVGNKEIRQKLALVKTNERFLKAIQEKIEEQRRHQFFQKKIREYPASEKIVAFMKSMDKSETKGFSAKRFLSIQKEKNLLLKKGAIGSISGTVLVESVLPPFDQEVGIVVFDSLGFPAGATTVDNATGSYTVVDLQDGVYYVVTFSLFVDELYNDVPLDFFENWRQATLVPVTDGTATAGIDFDLLKGADVTGTFFQADGVTPIAFTLVELAFLGPTNPRPLFTRFTTTGVNGEYEVNVPIPGAFKVLGGADGFGNQFFDNKPDFETADVIQVTSLGDSVSDINFSLEPKGMEEPVEGGRISGTVTGPDGAPLIFAFVFAFDLADTTIAGLGLTDFMGNYEIAGLQAGSYILYADNLLGFLLPSVVQGEYYDDAATSDMATPITINAMIVIPGINFELQEGAVMTGNVSDDTGAPLDSVLVIAVKNFLASGVSGFIFDDIDIGLAFTDQDGDYFISGLSSGEYLARTATITGPNNGRVIDRYYPDVPGLHDFELATPITVTLPDTTSGIDLVLPVGAVVTGNFFEIDGATPLVGEGSVIAFNVETGLPALASTFFNPEDASYELRPLPTGNFILLAFGASDSVTYVPLFYDGRSSPETADVVAVTAPNVTSGINLNMLRAGIMEGFVHLAPGLPAGADSVAKTFVIAFDAASGEVVGLSPITFAGGYRIGGLPPGQFKVGAVSARNGYPMTYHGGGITFDDVNSAFVQVMPDATTAADILLNKGEGTITGSVLKLDGSEPLNGVFVFAYDGTGHLVSSGVTGIDLATGMPGDHGAFTISGLHPGGYYARTFSMPAVALQFQGIDVNVDGEEGDDPLAGIFGLLGGAEQLFANFNVELFADAWYENQIIIQDLQNFDPFGFLFGLLFAGPGSLLPIVDEIPAKATEIPVTSPGVTENINFVLPSVELADLIDNLTSVSEPEISLIPDEFQLSQNYPNPFNPGTVINYHVPINSEVALNVYNMLGQKIRVLFDGIKEAGVHTATWDGRDDRGREVAAGLYFVRLRGDDVTLTRKMLLVR